MDNQRGNIEVSLPGAGESEPTILEVINRNTITNSETEAERETTSPQSQPLEYINQEIENELLNNDIPNVESITFTTDQLHKIAKDTLGNINLNTNNKDTEKNESENILDIESHLIETFENFSVSEESDNSGVAIRECQPAKEEFKRSSQIETETSPKTIIEIEPSIPKILKPIELDLDLNIKKQFGIETTETIDDIIPNILKNENNKLISSVQANEGKNLTSHIEETKYECAVIETQFEDFNKIKDSIKENLTINSDLGIGINGLQNCITPLEEEEKKKLLDSLPQLDENDSKNLSIQAKKEYYQSLRDYLDKHQDDRPPVPIQTYRWEDLRRAKEKGGYPWTHLYKRPLGPDEEPEIVLLLRKSQEFRFSSESPRSLKKVRIHDQVLIKETERYINDLSDTEDNPEVITENIKTNEDNHSINSESAASSPSDSVPKKSKLSKLKGILKRHNSTNETRVNPENKSVNQKTGKTIDGEENLSVHSESAIPDIRDSVSEDKKSKLSKLKGLVQRQSSDAKIKKPKEATSIFYSDNSNDPTIEDKQTVFSESEGRKSKFDKFIDIGKGEKNIEGGKIDKKETLLFPEPDTVNSSPSEIPAEEDNHSIHSESATIGLRGQEDKTSKLSKVKEFIKRRSGNKIQEDTKSVQSDSALEGKESKLKKLQRTFKFRKDFEKQEEQSKISGRNLNTEDTQSVHSESAVPESKKFNLSKLQGFIKRKPGNKQANITQEDTKSLQSESAVSSKSDSTLERKKFKLSNLKGIFKGQSDTKIEKTDELEKTSTDLDEPISVHSPTDETQAIHTETESSTSIPKNTATKLTKIEAFLKERTPEKNPASKKVVTSSIIESVDKKTETTQKDTKTLQIESAISSKSDSTLERKKLKLSNLKGIFKVQSDVKIEKTDELGKTSTDLDDPNSSDSPTDGTQNIQTETESSTSIPKNKASKLTKIQAFVKERTTEKSSASKKVIKSPIKESVDKKTETTQEDTKSLKSESAVSSKSDSTLERKKSKLSNLKAIFKTQKSTEFEKTTRDLDEPNSPNSHTDETQSIHSETQSNASVGEPKTTKLKKLKGIVKRRSGAKKPRPKKLISSLELAENCSEAANYKSEDSPKKEKCCQPIMDKLKTLTDKQFKKRNIKKVSLKDAEKIILEEEQKILKLRESPKAVRGEIPKFVEKQDSEDLLEIVQLEESPSQKRKEPTSSILIPDEIIEISSHTVKVQERQQNIDPSITPEPTVSEILEVELKSTPPVKALRKIKTHIYEDIENIEPTLKMKIDEILQLASVEALKKSLAAQDQNVIKDMESNKKIALDRMGSSEEEMEKTTTPNGINHLAPISSIDSASSDEQEKRTQLSPVAEESDVCSTDGKEVIVIEVNRELDMKSSLKREASPSPSDKKVTFSHVEDDAEPHREDIEIPEELKGMPNRWSTMK